MTEEQHHEGIAVQVANLMQELDMLWTGPFNIPQTLILLTAAIQQSVEEMKRHHTYVEAYLDENRQLRQKVKDDTIQE